MHSYKFPMVAATATVMIIHLAKDGPGRILLGVRSKNANAFPGKYCLPGGFLNPKTLDSPGETLEEAAVREVFEETGLTIDLNDLKLFHVHSDPDTDPRCHVINTCYWVTIEDEDLVNLKAGDDLEDIVWDQDILVDNFLPEDKMAFNHRELILRGMYDYLEFNDLLPKEEEFIDPIERTKMNAEDEDLEVLDVGC